MQDKALILEASKPGTHSSGFRRLQLIKMSTVPDEMRQKVVVQAHSQPKWTNYRRATPEQYQKEAQNRAEQEIYEKMMRDVNYRNHIMADPVWGPYMRTKFQL